MSGVLEVGQVATARVPRRARAARLARGALVVAIIAIVVAAGAWGRSGAGNAAPPPAAVGEDVTLGHGAVRVDRVGDEDIPAMPMPMSGPGMTEHGSDGKMPHVPPGMRRIGIDITLLGSGTTGGVRVHSGDFEIAIPGRAPIAPVADDVMRNYIPARTSLAGNLAFNVPSGARNLQLRIRGARRAIALTLGAAPPSSHHAH